MSSTRRQITQSTHPLAVQVKVEGIIQFKVKNPNPPNNWNTHEYKNVAYGIDTTGEPVAFVLPTDETWLLWRRTNGRAKTAERVARKWVESIEHDDAKLDQPYYRYFGHGPMDFAPEHPTQSWRDVARTVAYNERYTQFLNKNAFYLRVDPASFQGLPIYDTEAEFEADRRKAIGVCPLCGLQPWRTEGNPLAMACDGDLNNPHSHWSKVIPIPYNPTLPGYANPLGVVYAVQGATTSQVITATAAP